MSDCVFSISQTSSGFSVRGCTHGRLFCAFCDVVLAGSFWRAEELNPSQRRPAMRKSIVRVGSTVGGGSGGRARGASRVSLSHLLPETPENGRLLFAGRLLSVGDDVQIQQGAITFLQRLAEPLVVVSVHGARVRAAKCGGSWRSRGVLKWTVWDACWVTTGQRQVGSGAQPAGVRRGQGRSEPARVDPRGRDRVRDSRQWACERSLLTNCVCVQGRVALRQARGRHERKVPGGARPSGLRERRGACCSSCREE